MIMTAIAAHPGMAAQTVLLKYSILRESISVSELGELARTGKASRALTAYLDLAQKKPEDLQSILYRPIEIDPVLLSKMLNSFLGGILLDQVSEVIHTPSQRSSRESLRGALITSALKDRNVRLIEVLENYPTESVEVEGDRLLEIYQQIKKATDWIPRLPL
jgi:hypothetical protein